MESTTTSLQAVVALPKMTAATAVAGELTTVAIAVQDAAPAAINQLIINLKSVSGSIIDPSDCSRINQQQQQQHESMLSRFAW